MRPPNIKVGDKVAMVAPSGRVNPKDIDRASAMLRDWGLDVVLSPNLYADHHQYSGTDEQRLNDLQNALDDKEISAVICARGGYGLTRIIDHIDLSGFKSNPKWVIGYSDITALHYLLSAESIESIHSIMPSQMGLEGSEDAVLSLRELMLGGEMRKIVTSSHRNQSGEAEGKLIGGNISLIESMLGTKTEVPATGKILFIEDVGEYLYRLDRMLVHLDRAGVFSDIAGLVVGSFTSMNDGPTPFGMQPYEMISEICNKYSFPALFDAPIGHSLNNQAVPVGRHVRLLVESNSAQLFEAAEEI